jgi:hypothetical protein
LRLFESVLRAVPGHHSGIAKAHTHGVKDPGHVHGCQPTPPSPRGEKPLEEGNFDVFSAPVYIRGFVRTYSALLKLDVPQVMAALEAELAQTTKFSEPPHLTERPRGVLDLFMLQLSKVDWQKGLIGFGVVVSVVVAFSAWYSWRHYDPLKGLKPVLYQSTQNVSGDTLPLPTPAPRH